MTSGRVHTSAATGLIGRSPLEEGSSITWQLSSGIPSTTRQWTPRASSRRTPWRRWATAIPGTAMSLAPAAYLLFQKVMRRDPSDNDWIGRDRFILSVGHSSLTQYVQLYFGGYGLELDDLKALRTWGSKTPGHPEYGHTDGVEITTGPLGQGLASAVGFAYAARYERGLFDPDAAAGHEPVRPLHLRDRRRRRPAGGRHQRGVARSPATRSSATSSRSTTATRSRSRTTPTSPSPRTSQARYEAYGWHVQVVDWKKTGEYVEDVAGAATPRSRRPRARPTSRRSSS